MVILGWGMVNMKDTLDSFYTKSTFLVLENWRKILDFSGSSVWLMRQNLNIGNNFKHINILI